MNDLSGLLGRVGERKDILLVVLLLAVVFMMVLPLPPLLLDILIAVNITISVVLLMMSVYIGSPLQFSVFPAVLLITTLFRLALSVSTTRMILLQADAGQIVNTFGSFVVGGNLVVGIIIFLIITIVQFLVITKGAERVAEVSARFSLDAMPGKQMSIDGDMRAGVIDVNEARARRAVIEKESQMFGSMDGAMKFVKGDAIAGLIIIVVNILGGIAIGVTQKGLSTADALQLYAVLTVGDGMVSQVPALLIAITAGIIVTRVSSDESADLGSDIGEQVVAQPKALLIGGLLLVLFGLIPGFPTLTFLALALLVGGGGYFMLWRQRAQASAGSRDLPALLAQGAGAPSAKARGKAGGGKPKAGRLAEQEEFALTVPLLIDVDASLQERLEAMSLNEELVRVRRALYLDFGVPFPGIHLRFNEAMGDGEYWCSYRRSRSRADACGRAGCWCANAPRSWNCSRSPTSRRSCRCRERKRAGWSRRIRIAWSVPAVPAWAWSRCSPGTCPMCCGSTPRISSASRRRATCWSRWSRVTASW